MKSIIRILVVLILIVLIMTDIMNPFIEYLPIFWTFSLISTLNYKFKYRNGQIKNELRFLTKNDSYIKILPFIFGIMLVVGGIIALLMTNEYLIFISLLTFNGILLIVSGFWFVPSGVISIKKNKLNSISGYTNNSIKISQLSEINLFLDKIIFKNDSNKKIYLEHLNLNLNDFTKISDFLNAQLNHNVELKTYGNNG